MDCEYREAIDVTPWHGDVFDHPDYKYICTLSGKEVIPFIQCRRCWRRNDQQAEVTKR